ncbi:hypothetical protein [Pedobacter sp.]
MQPSSEGKKTEIERVVLEERAVKKGKKKSFIFFLRELKSFLPLQPGSEGTAKEIERMKGARREVEKKEK